MLCRCMTIRAQEHEAPYEGGLSLNWNREVRPKMRVVLWTYPKEGLQTTSRVAAENLTNAKSPCSGARANV
jgi:hypothetical protein